MAALISSIEPPFIIERTPMDKSTYTRKVLGKRKTSDRNPRSIKTYSRIIANSGTKYNPSNGLNVNKFDRSLETIKSTRKLSKIIKTMKKAGRGASKAQCAARPAFYTHSPTLRQTQNVGVCLLLDNRHTLSTFFGANHVF